MNTLKIMSNWIFGCQLPYWFEKIVSQVDIQQHTKNAVNSSQIVVVKSIDVAEGLVQ